MTDSSLCPPTSAETGASTVDRVVIVYASVRTSRDLERWRDGCSGDFMGPPEHLLHQAGPRNEHVVNLATQALSQSRKGVQRIAPVRLGLLKFGLRAPWAVIPKRSPSALELMPSASRIVFVQPHLGVAFP